MNFLRSRTKISLIYFVIFLALAALIVAGVGWFNERARQQGSTTGTSQGQNQEGESAPADGEHTEKNTVEGSEAGNKEEVAATSHSDDIPATGPESALIALGIFMTLAYGATRFVNKSV